MPIYVFERFNNEIKGDKWEDIVWDFAAPSYTVETKSGWLLKCDFRLPHRGIFYIPHPTDDTKALEFKYDTPAIMIPDYIPGAIRQKSFTPALKAAWEALPNECTFQLGEHVTLTARKEIVDALEHSIDGYLYFYRPVELLVVIPL